MADVPTRRTILALLAGTPAVRIARAWQEEPEPSADFRFSTGVQVVNVLATVRDRDGNIVRDLTAEDFALEVDGRPEEIRYFSQQLDQPLILGLLVDTSGSVQAVLGEEVKASRRFLRQVLREDQDRGFVARFAGQIELLQDLTPSRDQLDDALSELDPGFQLPRWLRLPGWSSPPRGGGRGGTSLYDAVFLGADEVMRPHAGRKAMIAVSDGEDQGSLVSLATAIEAAQRADTLVYSIRFFDRRQQRAVRVARGRRGRRVVPGPQALQRISQETGGAYFDTSEGQPLEEVFAAIEEELRNQYNLGFTPSAAGEGYRTIRVTVTRPGLTVRARDGYYAAD